MPPLEKVIADYAAGMTQTQMAKAYDISAGTVKSFLYKKRISKRRTVAYPPDEAIVECLQAGDTIVAMARKFNISTCSLRLRIVDRRLREFVEPPPPPPPSGLQASPIKHIVTALDGSKISVPRIPTIHGTYEARP